MDIKANGCVLEDDVVNTPIGTGVVVGFVHRPGKEQVLVNLIHDWSVDPVTGYPMIVAFEPRLVRLAQ